MTFEEWKAKQEQMHNDYDAENAWNAGVASRQAEIDALQKKYDAMYRAFTVADDARKEWHECYMRSRESRDELQKRIDELEAKREGFKLVPRKPTQQIYRAFYDAFNSANAGNTAQCFKVGYKAMLSAVEGE